jgi:hypothetical protein
MLGTVPVDLDDIAVVVAERAASWKRLGVTWDVKPEDPNHGKAVVVGEFESTAWLGELLVWVTGEADLGVGQKKVDGCIVNKHYKLASRADLNALMAELSDLLEHGSVPPSALIDPGPFMR